MGKGSAPKAPDPQQTAAAQTATNVATAQANAAMNNINQVTPYGNLTYNQTGKNFIADPNGQQYWVDGSGQYHTSLPTRDVATGGSAGHYETRRVSGGHGDSYSTQVWVPGNNGSSSSQTYTPDGWTSTKGYYVPTYTATQTLSPEQQAIFDQTQAAQLNLGTLANTQSARLNEILGQNFNPLATAPAAGTAGQFTQYSAAPELQTSYDYGGAAYNQKVEDALFDRLNAQLGQDKSSLDAQLANQGIKLGSTAYSNAQADFGRNVNDARTAAILNATQQQAQLADIANQAATFSNNAMQQNFANKYQVTSGNNQLAAQTFDQQNALRNQYLNEQYASRSQPINEIAALLSGSQIQNPSFVNTPTSNIPTVDYAGLVQQNYANQMQAYQQKQAQSQSLLGGLFGLGAAGIMASDKRVKEDVEPAGKVGGHNVYSYRYKGKFDDGRRHVGVMAQEVEKKRPDAVLTGNDGVKRVNYGALFGLGKAA